MVPDVEEEWSSVAAPPVSGAVPVISGSGEDNTDVSDLPKSTIEYYTNIEQVLERDEFDNEADRSLLEEKLLDQITSDGITKILYHWDGSRVIERMLVGCSSETLLSMGQLILEDVVQIACHGTASHVLELFVMKLTREIYTNETPAVVELAEGLFRRLCLCVAELIASIHGSFTLRLVLQVLVGFKVEEDKKRKGGKRWEIGKDSFYTPTSGTHPKLRRILHKFTKRLVKEDAGVLLWTDQGAPLLSVLLQLLHHSQNKSLESLKSTVIDSFQKEVTEYKGFDQFGALPAVLLDSKASYVVQALIKVCSKDELVSLYDKHFKKILVPLSLHPVANYTIQTLLERAPTRAIAEDMCGQIVPVVEDLLAESATGVVISLVKCCHHHGLTSYKVMQVLREAFHIPEDAPEHFFRCLMSMTTHDVLLGKIELSKKPTQSGKPRRDRFEATLTGSLLLQGLFKLGEISLLEEGVCGLSEDHIFYLSTNPQSSHAIQAYLTSLTIPSTSKHRFMKTAAFVVDRLVTTPSGSRIVEDMWSAADNEIKSSIAQVLMEKEQQIKDNTYGAIVWRNCNLKAFKMGLKSWVDSETKKKRKIDKFKSAIGGEPPREVTQNDENDTDKICNDQITADLPKSKKRKDRTVVNNSETSVVVNCSPKKRKKAKKSVSVG